MSRPSRDIRQAAHHWRARIDDGGLAPSEQAEFERWIAADPRQGEAFAEAELLWKALGAIDYDPALDRPSTTEKLRSAWIMAGQALQRRLRLAIGGLAIASCALAALVVTVERAEAPSRVAPASLPVVYETARAEIREITLADGSRITLGAQSRIDVTLAESSRSVELLSGAAFFEVADDESRPFTVRAGAAEVRVTGTTFDLQRRQDALQVAVAEGSVVVSHPFATTAATANAQGGAWTRRPGELVSAVALAAGQAVTASRDGGLSAVEAAPAGQLGAWRSGQLVYVRATLAEVIEDANRYAARPIAVESAAQELRLSGTFDANDVDGLLATVVAALPVRLESRGNAQVIVIAQ